MPFYYTYIYKKKAAVCSEQPLFCVKNFLKKKNFCVFARLEGDKAPSLRELSSHNAARLRELSCRKFGTEKTPSVIAYGDATSLKREA